MTFMICINALLAIALCIVILACCRERSKNVTKYNSLQHRNEQLAKIIEELTEEKNKLMLTQNEIMLSHNKLVLQNQVLQQNIHDHHVIEEKKDMYFTDLLSRAKAYLTNADEYRKAMLKYAKSNTIVDVVHKLMDDECLKKEEEQFYSDFDNFFLTMHPDFIKNFNAMFADDDKVELKNNEVMTTELRIFALIRMGINDPVKIASFLNCSLPTIYNYRSRLKNKSICNKEEFDKRLMEC